MSTRATKPPLERWVGSLVSVGGGVRLARAAGPAEPLGVAVTCGGGAEGLRPGVAGCTDSDGGAEGLGLGDGLGL
ncbi:MAG: hypothetical protein M3301_08810, partial [Chloroflexota bacterium]|nr:hypothetical protein [Chloroflexota bacterium]